jgi:hypothetical protein
MIVTRKQTVNGNGRLSGLFMPGRMVLYRFITRHRTGKWYADLRTAQLRANAIGAGFLDPAGNFVPYRGTVLELRSASVPDGEPG